ncbi:MAG: hypothetical protein SFY32_13180 [Bacteroidota bacterium]|nr:hypothetical protein [Bacteroidota bacterium]
MDLQTKYDIIEKIVQTKDDLILQQVIELLNYSEVHFTAEHEAILNHRLSDYETNKSELLQWNNTLDAIEKEI